MARSGKFQPLSPFFAFASSLLLLVPLAAAHAEEAIDFDRQIRPIFSNTCFTCHGPDKARREADLRLDREDSAKAAVIVPGHPDESELIRRITSEDEFERMPPVDAKQQLTPEQIELLKKWVSAGAPWTQHWSFVPPQAAPLPSVSDPHWPQNAIDHFILNRHDREHLTPSAPASKETILRRVTLDLTGLPPTLEELDAFLADNSPDAYEKVVDRLLASPRYGEHMALEWLAAARYADTNGYQEDGTRSNWPWRDWVIRAMNENLPFDKFTIYQLAGDLLPNPTQDQLIATGFNRNHALNGEGGRNPEESRVEYVMDRVDTTTTVWLGLTVACARCHDHKYDPITHKDFYRFYAYFNSVDENGGIDNFPIAKPVLPLPTDEQKIKVAELRDKIAGVNKEIDALDTPSDAQQAEWDAFARRWLDAEKQDTLWQPLKGAEITTKQGSKTKVLEDNSVLVTELVDSNEDYTLTIPLAAGTHYGLRLEGLKHESLYKGLFSTAISGDFRVTTIEVELNGEKVKLIDPKTSVPGGDGPYAPLDGNARTGFTAGKARETKDTPTWMARFEKPLEGGDGAKLIVRLRNESTDSYAPICRFRVSLTEYPQPTLDKDLGLPADVIAALNTPAKDRTEEYLALIASQTRVHYSWPLREKIREFEEEIKAQEQSFLKTMVMGDRGEPRDTYLLNRGVWDAPDTSEKLYPNVPECLPPLPEGAPQNRLTLAQSLVDPAHPLTSRVTVNRYWQHFFGTGLVKTSEDFGVQGERPVHPELLDWLAVEFIRNGWDVKALHKLIVMSATYRQSSDVTPELAERDLYNRLLARGPRFRMTAQALRDQALALSGLLVEKTGGPGVMPYQPPGIWEDFSLGKISYQQSQGEDLYRRSVYTFWRRSVGPTTFFDNAGRQVCTVRPSLTNTPLHALTLLNDTTFVEAGRVFAERVLREAGPSPSERVNYAFRLATCREPSEQEVASLLKSLKFLLDEYGANPVAARELIEVGEASHDEQLDTVETAAYGSLMNAILNLDEVETKG
jgi:mono/diheme cytochrome c family protein